MNLPEDRRTNARRPHEHVVAPEVTPMKVAIAGASGFIGSRLASHLAEQGHHITAVTRKPENYEGAGSAVRADVNDAKSLLPALEDQEIAYYLVHSLATPDFAERDRTGASTFAQAAVQSGVTQVIYLGGLGDESQDLSEHLRSRREVEKILMDSAPTTALRAGIVIGEGSISWEILRQLVVRLPVMITPRWVETRTQPIALSDALFTLMGSLGRRDMVGQSYEIGGPEPLTYRQHDDDRQPAHGPSEGDSPGAATLPEAFLALAALHHRCRPHDSSSACRLDVQRGRCARPSNQRSFGPRADEL